MKRVVIISLIVPMVWCCKEKESPNKFSDPILARIAELQDRRKADSLIQYFKSDDASYRSAAALSFASVQDSAASPLLGNLLLEDKESAVRRAAAFALGQTGGVAAVNALIPAIKDADPYVVKEVLEALGKTVRSEDLARLGNFKAIDSIQQEGLALAYYRLGLRNLADTLIARKQSQFLNATFSLATRRAAAHFFSRAKIVTASVQEKLIQAALHDPAAEVRMAATAGLKNLEAKRALPVLKEIMRDEKDYRVRNSGVRACTNFSWTEGEEVLFGALQDSSLAVQISASELILRLAKGNPVKRLERDIAACTHGRVRANLYGALLSSGESDSALKGIFALYDKTDDYGKADLLTAMSFATGKNELRVFEFISKTLIESGVPVIESTAAEALVSLNHHEAFFKSKKNDFAEVFKNAIAKGDPAVVGIVAGALGEAALGYKTFLADFSFLLKAREKLQMPKDIESMQPLVEAIAYFEGKEKPAPLKNNYNHPLNWELIKSITRDQRVLIKTNRGDIRLRLMIEEAPGSVSNFVALVNMKYFDRKFFHRVVPNFVIQTGCNRGDGFGSEDYSIRSEFSGRRYRTGSVGMASAGKDTEGTQWFITHSPTPHLDGRYTVFAEVEQGQDIVDLIEVGDVMNSVALIKN